MKLTVVDFHKPAFGGHSAYVNTFLSHCARNGYECQHLTPDDSPFVRLISKTRAGRFQRLLGKSKLGLLDTLAWLASVAIRTLLLKIIIASRGRGKIVCMDVAASCAVKPVLLIVHGDYRSEALVQIGSNMISRAVTQIIDKRGFLRPEKIIVVDDFLTPIPRRWKRSDAIVIPNGIDLRLFDVMDRTLARHKLGLDSQRRVVLFIGSFKEKFVDRIPIWREALEKKGYRTIHPKRVRYELMPLYYNAADITVSMSTVRGIQRAILESLACGTPVISNNSPLAFFCPIEKVVDVVANFRSARSREELRKAVLPYDMESVFSKVVAQLEPS